MWADTILAQVSRGTPPTWQTRKVKRIRVLRVIARMNVGGPAVEISNLMRHMDVDQFEQILVTGTCGQDEADFLETQAPDVTAHRIRGLGRAVRPWDDAFAFRALVSKIRRLNPDIIHTHTAKAGVLGRLAARTARSKAKIVHTYHGHLLHGYFSPVKTQAIVTIEKRLALRSDALVTVAQGVRDDLLRAGIGSPEQYQVIYPGVESPTLHDRHSARAHFGLGGNEFVVGYIGRVTHIKRPDRLADVVTRLHTEASKVRILVAGSGDLMPELERRVQDEQLPITLAGWQSDVGLVLSACDAIVLTSDNEGTPLSLIQAAMTGLPVVATNVGSVSEVVADGYSGFLTLPDPLQIADSLISLASSENLARRLGNFGFSWSRENFGVRRFVSQHDTLYRSLVQ